MISCVHCFFSKAPFVLKTSLCTPFYLFTYLRTHLLNRHLLTHTMGNCFGKKKSRPEQYCTRNYLRVISEKQQIENLIQNDLGIIQTYTQARVQLESVNHENDQAVDALLKEVIEIIDTFQVKKSIEEQLLEFIITNREIISIESCIE
jgi:hypothetical protein